MFETLGAINLEGEELLRMIFSFASKRLGRELTTYCGRAYDPWSYQECLSLELVKALHRFRNRQLNHVGHCGE